MSKSSRKDIFDALTSDSSADGCDPDWRRSVLFNADHRDKEYVKGEIRRGNQIHTDGELEVEFSRKNWI